MYIRQMTNDQSENSTFVMFDGFLCVCGGGGMGGWVESYEGT